VRITVERVESDNDATISKVYVDDVYICDGIEDEHRDKKVAGETRIPAGKYKILVRTWGGFHTRYTAKFPKFHKGMLEVAKVPGFDSILIHVGNTDDDTEGCLLVGKRVKGKMFVSSSVKTYSAFYQLVIESALQGELEIEYINRDSHT
jgi:hypothetical protein